MFLLRIWLIFCAITWGMVYATAIIAKQRFRERYPEIKMNSLTLFEKIFSFIRSFIMTCCPIVHLMIIGGLLLDYEGIIERTIEKLKAEQKW